MCWFIVRLCTSRYLWKASIRWGNGMLSNPRTLFISQHVQYTGSCEHIYIDIYNASKSNLNALQHFFIFYERLALARTLSQSCTPLSKNKMIVFFNIKEKRKWNVQRYYLNRFERNFAWFKCVKWNWYMYQIVLLYLNVSCICFKWVQCTSINPCSMFVIF